MSAGTQLEITSRRCDECLVSPNRIVRNDRATEILRTCQEGDVHFICHKASLDGRNVHCRGVHEAVGPCFGYRFAKAVGIPIVEVDPEDLGHG